MFLGKPFFDIWNDTINATVSIYGASAGEHFGWSVANGSDLNGDGVYDLIVGAPDNSSGRGSVYVFYGTTTWNKDSTTQYTMLAWRDCNGVFVGENAGDRFGWSVAGLGNFIGSSGTALNGDFCAGAPYADFNNIYDCGKGYVFLSDNAGAWSPSSPVSASNANYILSGERRIWEYFGWSVAGAGDMDNDGLNESLVGAPGRNRAYIFDSDGKNLSVDFENNVLGTISGSYLDTQASDDIRESIAERKSSVLVWNDDFESDKGWAGYGGTGEWQRGTPTAKNPDSSLGQDGEPDPSSAHSGTKILGTDIGIANADNGVSNGDGFYENNTNYANITSPPISTLGYTGTVLRFWKWLNVDGAGRDVALVWVSNDGSTWTEVFTSNQTCYCDKNWGWIQLVFNISAVADNQAKVYIRFGIKSDASYKYSGWNIDDVEILAGATVSLYTYASGGGIDKWINRSANAGTTVPATLVAPNEAAYTNYGYVAASENTVGSLTITTNYYGLWRFNFRVSNNIEDIAGIYFGLEGTSGESSGKVDPLVVRVWNYTAGRWDDLVPWLGWYFRAGAPGDGATGNTNSYGINTTILSGFANYFNSSKDIHFRTYAQVRAKGGGIWIDYVELKVLARASYGLEHMWRIPAQMLANKLYVEGYTTGEGFALYYSFNGSASVNTWNYLGTLSSTTETIMSFVFNCVVLDNIWLGVFDTARNSVDTTQDTLYIDAIWITGIPYSILIGDKDTSFGFSASKAWDMNGDNYADVLLGAPGCGGPPVFLGTNLTVDGELHGNGTVTNDYTKLQQSDDQYESITEVKDFIQIWYDDFESDKGWTGYGGAGEWQRGTPNNAPAVPSYGYGRADPSSAHSGTKLLGNDIGVANTDNGTSNGDGLYSNS
ncbi:MAG: hypothetical protein ACP5LE_04775, partial [Thermoplasmata archaeon]